MQSHRWWRALMAPLLLAVATSGCSDDATTGNDGLDDVSPGAPEIETDPTGPPADDEGADDLPEVAPPEPSGDGRATLTIGDETWEFPQAVCVFGPEEIGDPDAEFVLSAIQGGLQLYATIDGFGHSISIDDIGDFDDPRVSWFTQTPLPGEDPVEFIVIDGDQVTATASFTGEDTSFGADIPGTLTATCA